MSYTKIHGVLPPMITPFKENGDVDFEGFASNVRKWNDNKLAGYLVIGSNSETAFLSEEEKLELVKLTKENAAPGRQILVGSGMDSVRETIKLTNKCAELGADAALVLTPHYYSDAMKSANLIRFFTEVADRSDIPVLIYNVSKFTHVNIEADAIRVLSQHPNIVGMKDSNGNVPQLATFLRVADPSFQVMTGTFGAWYPALCLGITGIISAMANCCPDPIADVQELFDAGKHDEALALYQRWFPVNAAVTGKYGIQGLKYAADKCGYCGGFVRNPLIDSTEKEKQELDAILAKAME
ncbi:MAG: dihydrodipicolinate synthase family protein [Firmicutes bacterium]|nr:dihydrodipicolinate synthase family protein [Bacillota bacterium]MBQ1887736.1 dihydrodipicolinate synthase family protein [Bacillota bacterium]